eukprot:scaffold23792_cov27-Phaeocystis_antarctica.AAC.1
MYLELPLEGLIDHELDADVREHGDQGGQQAGVQALEAAADLEDRLWRVNGEEKGVCEGEG